MEDKYSPEALKEKARKKFREMLERKSVAERWESVQKEMIWVFSGRPDKQKHQTILPKYCYNIFDLYARTIFKAFTPISQIIDIKNNALASTGKTIPEAKQAMAIDWEKLGEVIGIGDRTQMFFEMED